MWLCLSKCFTHYQHALYLLSLVAGKSRAGVVSMNPIGTPDGVDGVGVEPGSLGCWTSVPVLFVGIHLLF